MKKNSELLPNLVFTASDAQPPADPEEEAPPQTRFGLPWNPDW